MTLLSIWQRWLGVGVIATKPIYCPLICLFRWQAGCCLLSVSPTRIPVPSWWCTTSDKTLTHRNMATTTSLLLMTMVTLTPPTFYIFFSFIQRWYLITFRISLSSIWKCFNWFFKCKSFSSVVSIFDRSFKLAEFQNCTYSLFSVIILGCWSVKNLDAF